MRIINFGITQIIKFVDDFLNSITMYRLLLYYLIFLLVVAFIYSIFHQLPFSPVSLVFSSTFLIVVSFVGNKIFEKIFNVQTNVESLYITALILALIITPIKVFNISNIGFLFWAALLAMASKYILAINKKHVFNPAAIAVTITGMTIGGYASWWVGTLVMLPFVLLGVLIIRKIRRFDLVFYFFLTAFSTSLIFSFAKGSSDIVGILVRTVKDTPILFFAFIMLSEPLTTPATKTLQSIYGALTGILFAPQFHIGGFFTTPEIALTIANVFSYAVSPKYKLILSLKEKIKLTDSIYDFVFSTSEKFNFIAGQYMEWTLGHKHSDDRGNRRYFTFASSPTESEVRIGVKFEKDRSSSYKTEMLSMKKGDKIVASQLAGDFTLVSDVNKKLVFIAGGIGVTPFRSIIKYLIDKNEKRDIILIYNERTKENMVYKDVFKEAERKLGIKTIYFETEKSGHMTSETVKKEIPDFKERIFYLSGSNGMVKGFEDLLSEAGLPKDHVRVDYFPGY
ncbi:MAG TPA: FAD-dependent oxidoreductase [Candidatus Saccharimonadales bacterium]|nr:FAD-dependent oxidoreductase [Candidatus Saccharimonadales bacterium]